jgi:signal transduction histidine kinase/CheY-like chemotaxis protein
MTKPLTVLIVDDCEEDRTTYRRYLLENDRNRYEILEAEIAQDALDICRQQDCHLILLDLDLPDFSGLEFLDRLQQQSYLPLVVMITAYGNEELGAESIERGARRYVAKRNIRPDRLRQIVADLLSEPSSPNAPSVAQPSDRDWQVNSTEADEESQRSNINQQQILASTMLRIRSSLNLQKIFETTVEEVRHILACDRVVLCRFEEDRSSTVVAESVGTGWPFILGRQIVDRYFQGEGHKHYCEGRTQATTDVRLMGLNQCHLDLLESLQVRANLVVPVVLPPSEFDPVTEPARLWGLLVAHHCGEPHPWSPLEVGLMRDLSVQLAIGIQQAELLAQTQAALINEQRLNLFRSQIIATVAHEYQTPLTAILAAISTLKRHHDALSANQQSHFLDIIEQRSRQMSAMVNDTLMVHRSELRQVECHHKIVNLLELIETVVQPQRSSGTNHCQIEIVTEGNYDGFTGDAVLLRQIVQNLLSNSVKYSEEGGRIIITLRGETDQVILRVQDFGIGIPEGDRRNLFKAFYRGSNVGTISGTGLGLVILKSNAELHGGRVSLESRVGQGTIVSVYLPKVEPENDGLGSGGVRE